MRIVLLVAGVMIAGLVLNAYGTSAPLALESSIHSSVEESFAKWASSRHCLYTQDSVQYVTSSLLRLISEDEKKGVRYGVTTEELKAVVDGAVSNYLDQIIRRAPDSKPIKCVVDLHRLRFSAVPIDYGPGAGNIKVDGAKKGAAIFIDTRYLGDIASKFVLSVNRHRIQTMKCDDIVEIKPGENPDYFCNKT